jgi:hypothetical protein
MHGARWRAGLASLVGIVAACPAARAQQTPAPVSQTAAEPACFPACREGYVCARGQCVSRCNPPCPAGQSCVQGRRCEDAPTSPADGYEPPAPPRPKSALDRSHDLIGLHLGLGGSEELNGSSEDMATTYGVNLRADYPVARYLLIGPLFQFGAWRPDVEHSTYDYYTDIDLYLRGRVPIDQGSLGLQVWAGIPVGLTLSFLGGDHAALFNDAGFGWNIGVLVGAAIHFTREFGLFTELGWMQHKMSHGSAVNGGEDGGFRLSQTNLNLGFVL